MKRNYQKEMEQVIEKLRGKEPAPTLLLHSCCAPCSSYVLQYLSHYFKITVLYYNPNIYPPEEYWKRVKEQEGFIKRFSERAREEQRDVMLQLSSHIKEEWENGMQTFSESAYGQAASVFYPISFVEGEFEQNRFYEAVKGMEHLPEGGERCFRCYELRLRRAAEYAKQMHMDYFTTTLSISPLKNAGKLNEIGEHLAEEYGISYLCSDFKKKDGYKQSVALSKEYGMYRQDYCGCIFSMQERERQKGSTLID